MSSMSLTPLPGFDPRRVIWSPPDGRITPLCSYCYGPVPEVPLIVWTPAGWSAHFCDKCQREQFGIETFDDDEYEHVGPPMRQDQMALAKAAVAVIADVKHLFPDEPRNRGKFVFRTCPLCDHGKLKIHREIDNGKLRIICSTDNCLTFVAT